MSSKSPYPSVVDRYFLRKYQVHEENGGKEDICVLCHSNKICLITLAKSHDIIQKNRKVKEVNYKVSRKKDRAASKAVGKSKKGAQTLKVSDILCHLTCEDGTQFSIRSPIHGSLLEVNQAILTSPNLITDRRETLGYLAILLVKKQEYNMEMSRLLNASDYEARTVADVKEDGGSDALNIQNSCTGDQEGGDGGDGGSIEAGAKGL